MIKVKALKVFEDLYTGLVYNVGDILEISKERYEEIEKNLKLYGGNFLELIEDKVTEEETSEEVKSDETTED